MMEEALVHKLLSVGALTALVNDRINWLTRPQGISQLPAITLQSISLNRQVTLDGPNDLSETVVQIDCWAETHPSALQVSRLIKSTLEGQSFVDSGMEFQGSFIDNERQSFEEPRAESPERYYRVSIDMRIWSKSST